MGAIDLHLAGHRRAALASLCTAFVVAALSGASGVSRPVQDTNSADALAALPAPAQAAISRDLARSRAFSGATSASTARVLSPVSGTTPSG